MKSTEKSPGARSAPGAPGGLVGAGGMSEEACAGAGVEFPSSEL